MRLERLQYFAAVADTEHIGRAAQLLHISQPALSQQLRKLEKHLGTQLLIRHAGGVSLTPAGSLLAKRARSIVRTVDRAENEARDLAAGRSGRLRIAYTRSASDHRTRGLVSRYRRAHPHLSVETSSGWTSLNLSHLVDGSIDAAFVRTPIDDDRLDVSVVLEQELVALLPKDHSDASARPISAKRLRNETLLLWNRDQAPTAYDDILQQLWGSSRPAETRVEPDGEQLVAAVEAGEGFTVMGRERAEAFLGRQIHLQSFSGPRRVTALGIAILRNTANPAAVAFKRSCLASNNRDG